METEELERGAVSYDVYLYIFKSMGWPIISAYLVFRILQEVANIWRQFWLAEWAKAGISINITIDIVSGITPNDLKIRCNYCLRKINRH